MTRNVLLCCLLKEKHCLRPLYMKKWKQNYLNNAKTCIRNNSHKAVKTPLLKRTIILINIELAVIVALSIMYWTIITGLTHCSLILLLLAFLSVTYVTFRATLSILYK